MSSAINNIQNKQRVLFVRGFNTSIYNKLTQNVYVQFDNVFLSSNIICKYFDYDLDEDLIDVYKRLCDEIESNLYDVYVGHSMGGGLLMKYCLDNININQCKEHKIILMMPLIYINPIAYRLLNIVPDWLSLPKALVLPNNFLFETGNILNDTYNFIPIKQIKQMGKFSNKFRFNMLENDILQNKNFHLIYANDEMFTFIPDEILDIITNVHKVDGKHECFNENSNSNDFFKLFLSIINNK